MNFKKSLLFLILALSSCRNVEQNIQENKSVPIEVEINFKGFSYSEISQNTDYQSITPGGG